MCSIFFHIEGGGTDLQIVNGSELVRRVVQDPEQFIADGGWNFLDADGGDDEEGEEDEEDEDQEFAPDSSEGVCPGSDATHVLLVDGPVVMIGCKEQEKQSMSFAGHLLHYVIWLCGVQDY